MTDADIRGELREHLRAYHWGDPDTVIIEELGLRHGACRIDLVVVNGILHGFELKSDSDTLRRLPRQAETYNRVLDCVTLVVGSRHLDKATEMVPGWWGIRVAVGAEPQITLQDVRPPKENPSPDPLAIARLLWREEALALLRELGQATGLYSKPRGLIYAKLAMTSDIDFLRAGVRQRLKHREDWRPDGQRVSCGG